MSGAFVMCIRPFSNSVGRLPALGRSLALTALGIDYVLRLYPLGRALLQGALGADRKDLSVLNFPGIVFFLSAREIGTCRIPKLSISLRQISIA